MPKPCAHVRFIMTVTIDTKKFGEATRIVADIEAEADIGPEFFRPKTENQWRRSARPF